MQVLPVATWTWYQWYIPWYYHSCTGRSFTVGEPEGFPEKSAEAGFGFDNGQYNEYHEPDDAVMSVFFCITLPSGMGIYWIASAVFRTIIYLFIDKFFNNKSVDDIIEANKEKAANKAEKRGEQNAKLEEYAAMKTKNIDRRSISQIANAGKGNGDAKAEKKSESSNAGGKSSKKVDKNNAEADKKSISGYAHMLNRHDD